ncbi:unnamed protein product, partial [Phaeothamnion confervicola]
TCLAFATRCSEARSPAAALELLRRCEELLGRGVLSARGQREVRGFVHDGYAFYYLRRSRYSAALECVNKALDIHARDATARSLVGGLGAAQAAAGASTTAGACATVGWGHYAKCLVHRAAIVARQVRQDEALASLEEVLALVSDGRLDAGGSSNPQKLCLVAVTYHNAAAAQLSVGRAAAAATASHSARRLARLCLSYSSRWLPQFESTHKLALAAATASA